MNPLFLFMGRGHGKLSVSPSTASVTGLVSGATAYAGIQFNTSGEEFNTPTGGSSYTSSRGDWLDVGNSDEVWVECNITGGTLGAWNSDNAGTGSRLSLDTTRSWRMLRSTTGTDTTFATFDFYNAASGGNLIGSTGELVFTATRTP